MIFDLGAGGGNIVYITQAEYDALPDSKLTNGIEYRITDANVGESIASNLLRKEPHHPQLHVYHFSEKYAYIGHIILQINLT